MFRNRGWFGGGGLWKPKNPHSLEHLKYLYTLLSKNQTVTEQNRSLLVETLRSIAEILIWGDQNDGSVFDFFLEKNMLSFFLKIMKQKCGSYVCVQLLQTLNILFENIRNETSLYYLLSNNHVNSIIVHKFDFSDEEVMAYYISFLKTLSLKLNCHTIHFFYNEHTNDFPLYTEAIKFFNHPESMVRIAVRTLSLNVYRVEDKAMLKFIRDKTAAPYFSNLVWFIGNHVLELDSCVCNDADHLSCGRLSDLVAEHLDHLHYLNDIFCLDIPSLSKVLADHLMNRLLVPLYVYSLIPPNASPSQEKKPHVSSVTSIFLLSQVFLIMCHAPLVDVLAKVILLGNTSIFSDSQEENGDSSKRSPKFKPSFVAPLESLEKSLENTIKAVASGSLSGEDSWEGDTDHLETELQREMQLRGHNITDEEKQKQNELNGESTMPLEEKLRSLFVENQHPFLQAILSMLDSSHDDYTSLLSLCLLYAIRKNSGISEATLNSVLVPTDNWEEKSWYNVQLVEALLNVICRSCQPESKIRLVTLELCIQMVKLIAIQKGKSYLHDCHLAVIEGAKEEATLLLRNFYKSEEIFVDMFENEYTEMRKRPLNIEYLMMDASVLLPPTGTPMTGIELTKRLPCGEVERARRAIRVFFLLRDLSLSLRGERERQLPLTDPSSCIQTGKVLDLNNSDLISCTVVTKENPKLRRFLVVDSAQLILVEPDTKRLGWGVAMFVGFLQDVEVEGDKDDSRCLLVTVHSSAAQSKRATPLLTAKFVFDDHIRCMAANQRLSKGRAKARQRKCQQIAKLLELPANIQPCSSPPNMTLSMLRQEASARKHKLRYLSDYRQGKLGNMKDRKPPFMSNKVPGIVKLTRVEIDSSNSETTSQETLAGVQWRKEDIPLECISRSAESKSDDTDTQVVGLQQDMGTVSVPDLPKSLLPAEGPVISLLEEATKQEALQNSCHEPELAAVSPISPLQSPSPPSLTDNSDNNNSSVVSTPGKEYETSFIVNEDIPPGQKSKAHRHYDFAETYPPITSSTSSSVTASQDGNLTTASKHKYSNAKIQTV